MRKQVILKTLLISILGLTSTHVFADEENIYLQKNEKEKTEYKYIDGKIYYSNKVEQQQIDNKKIETQKSASLNYNAINNINKPKIEDKKEKTQQFKSPNEVFYIKGGQPCFEEAARYHNVDPWLLMSIAYVESRFNPKAINKNKNGSYDTGMMQINSIWIPTLKKKGIDKSLLNDACASTYIGAWILSDNIKRYGYNWKAIGAYNSANPKYGLPYAKKVYAAHAKITGIKNSASKK